MENNLEKMPYCKENKNTSPLAAIILTYLAKGVDPLLLIDSLVQESDDFSVKVAQMKLKYNITDGF